MACSSLEIALATEEAERIADRTMTRVREPKIQKGELKHV